MIRAAKESDIPEILRMGRLFWAQTAFAKIPLCPDSLVQTCRDMMRQELLLVADESDKLMGAIGLLASPLYANRDVLIAAELFWWIEPQARNTGLGKALMREMEQQAALKGIHIMSMITLEAVDPSKSGAVYERLGYQLSEHVYHKQIGGLPWQSRRH